MSWLKHPVILLVIYLLVIAANAALIQYTADLASGRVPVHPAVVPYIPTILAATGVITTVIAALLPAMWQTVRRVIALLRGGDA